MSSGTTLDPSFVPVFAGAIKGALETVIEWTVGFIVDALIEVIEALFTGDITATLLLVRDNSINPARSDTVPGLNALYNDMVIVFFSLLSIMIILTAINRMFFPSTDQMGYHQLATRVLAGVFIVLLGEFIWVQIFDLQSAIGQILWEAGGGKGMELDISWEGTDTLTGPLILFTALIFFLFTSTSIILTLLFFWAILGIQLVFICTAMVTTPLLTAFWIPQGGIADYLNQIVSTIFSITAIIIFLTIFIPGLISVGGILASADAGLTTSGDLGNFSQASPAETPAEDRTPFDFGSDSTQPREPELQTDNRADGLTEFFAGGLANFIFEVSVWLGTMWASITGVVAVFGRFARGAGGGSKSESGSTDEQSENKRMQSLRTKARGVGDKLKQAGGRGRQKAGKKLKQIGSQNPSSTTPSSTGSTNTATTTIPSTSTPTINGQSGSSQPQSGQQSPSQQSQTTTQSSTGQQSQSKSGQQSPGQQSQTTTQSSTGQQSQSKSSQQSPSQQPQTTTQSSTGQQSQSKSSQQSPSQQPQTTTQSSTGQQSQSKSSQQSPSQQPQTTTQSSTGQQSQPKSNQQSPGQQSQTTTQSNTVRQAQSGQQQATQQNRPNQQNQEESRLYRLGEKLETTSVTKASQDFAEKAKRKTTEFNDSLKGEDNTLEEADGIELSDGELSAFDNDSIEPDTQSELEMGKLTDTDVQELTDGDVNTVRDFDWEDAEKETPFGTTDNVDQLDNFNSENIDELKVEARHDDYTTARQAQKNLRDLRRRGVETVDGTDINNLNRTDSIDADSVETKRRDQIKANLADKGLTDEDVQNAHGASADEMGELTTPELAELERQANAGPHTKDKYEKAYSGGAKAAKIATDTTTGYLQTVRNQSGVESFEQAAEKARASDHLDPYYDLQGIGAQGVDETVERGNFENVDPDNLPDQGSEMLSDDVQEGIEEGSKFQFNLAEDTDGKYTWRPDSSVGNQKENRKGSFTEDGLDKKYNPENHGHGSGETGHTMLVDQASESGDEPRVMEIGHIEGPNGNETEAVRFYDPENGAPLSTDGPVNFESAENVGLRSYPNQGYVDANGTTYPTRSLHSNKAKTVQNNVDQPSQAEKVATYKQIKFTGEHTKINQ